MLLGWSLPFVEAVQRRQEATHTGEAICLTWAGGCQLKAPVQGLSPLFPCSLTFPVIVGALWWAPHTFALIAPITTVECNLQVLPVLNSCPTPPPWVLPSVDFGVGGALVVICLTLLEVDSITIYLTPLVHSRRRDAISWQPCWCANDALPYLYRCFVAV